MADGLLAKVEDCGLGIEVKAPVRTPPAR